MRFSTADLRSGEYPKSSSYPAHLRNRGKIERRTTTLTQGDTGHPSYEKSVSERVKGRGCPLCLPAKRSAWMGRRGIERNGSVADALWKVPFTLVDASQDPNEISSKSRKALEWHCPAAHTFSASPEAIFYKNLQCSQCVKPPLEKSHPHVVLEWADPYHSPSDFTSGSDKKVLWKCRKCDNQWSASIYSRTHGSICPFCAKEKRAEAVRLRKLKTRGSLADKFPQLIPFWDMAQNGQMNPSDITAGSHITIYWQCEAGHKWVASPNSMTDKRRKSICKTCKN